MVKHVITIIVFAFSLVSYGQISRGGQPMPESGWLESVQVQVARPSVAVRSTMVGKQTTQPLRFADPIYTNFTPQNSGSWETNVNGYNVWRLAIKSEGAKSLNLIFDEFYLNEDDKLFVYNPERTHVLGAFTKENNKPSKIFAVAPVAGDEIIIELQTKLSIDYMHELNVSAVNHDFLGVHQYLKRQSDFGDSGDCNINASCESICSDEVRRAVCKIITDGTMLCSGTMVNSSDQTGNPMFLTAGHCATNYPSGSLVDYTAQTIIFYFNYESPSCDPVINGTDAQTVSGAELLAYVENMDFALLRMAEMPKDSYRPYLAGWTRDETITNPVFSVHHPQGDVKKIAISSTAPVNGTYNANSYGGVSFLENIHWHIANWERGVTEGGSSGSGLFTEDQLLIGNLSGGAAYCGNPVDDYYVRFNQAWANNSEKDKSLSQWLSPDDVTVNELSGRELSDFKRISHLNDEKSAQLLYDNEFTGSWSGHNERNYTAYASSFYDIESAKISGIYVVPSKAEYSSQTVNVIIWDNNNGVPGDVLWSENNIPIMNFSANRETLLELSSPLEVNNSFFAGFELSYSANVDTFSVYMSDISAEEGNNRAFIKQANGEWVQYNTVHPSGNKSTYWIDVLASDAVFVGIDDVPTSISDSYVKIVNNPIKTGEISFKTNLGFLERVEVFSINGSKLQQVNMAGVTEGSFSVRSLPAGLYLIRFSSKNKSIVKRVVINK
ncbi:T9SS type A sorting domain-containing protein [Carboxylicivirga sp. A043]|uniref:trypsin-like peptidase domain-containing protein n=1 Tax=Carboxylicivirga litoralis TaxID=2816963 RepID=UPI0021CB87D6|nr:trypsin-like peptidase domain-containing protein [Carboxylicivirga sp. A043]MCU4157679.1 T9SS type A sorting domain-containing protein [Carboxylicivirga sp. A043]